MAQRQRLSSGQRNTIMLVNSVIENTFVVRPERRQDLFRPLAGSLTSVTLESLRNGITLYTTSQNCHGSTHSGEEYLTIFGCKLPKKKKYFFYKRVKIVDLPEVEAREVLCSLFSMVNRYIECFATLAEFNAEYNLHTRAELPNVLVVDKVWTHDTEKRIFIPIYEPLKCDSYTDHVLSVLKRSFNFERIQFISTLNTTLFANRHVLREPLPVETTADPPSELPKEEANEPPKKMRKLDRPSDQEELPSTSQPQNPRPPSKRTVSFADEQQQQLVTVLNDVSNPTLIVFNHNFLTNESLLVCSISVEIHLSKAIVFK